MKEENESNINFDKIILELGEFGKFQLITYILLVLPVILTSASNGSYVFSAEDMEYRCHVPECELSIDNATLNAEWLTHAMPDSSEPRRCRRYAPINLTDYPDNDTCSADMFYTNKTIECEKFVFGEGQSIVKELEIQCEFWKRTLVGTMHSVGLLVALPLVGFISDRYGRRVAFILSAFLAGVLGLCRSFSNTYWVFVLFEFLEPMLGSGVYSSAFILGMELVGPKRRVLGATILCMFYSFGAVLLGIFAWLFPYWRTLLRAIYIPSLFFIFYFWFIEESVRWLISRGRFESAIAVLKKAAKVNGVTLTEKSMENLYSNAEMKMEMKEKQVEKHEEPIVKQPSHHKQVFASRIILLRVLKCSFWWITCTFVYYGLSINSVSLVGNIYLNYILVSFVEMPAYLTGYFMLDRLGRKYTLCSAFLMSGIACISFPFLPKLEWLMLMTYLVGKYFITIAFSSLYVYTSELFPTPLRHSLLGTCSMIGRIGSITAPQTPLLAEYYKALPSLLFGSCSFISGLMMFTSPETLNIKLPDTIEEAENLSKARRVEKE